MTALEVAVADERQQLVLADDPGAYMEAMLGRAVMWLTEVKKIEDVTDDTKLNRVARLRWVPIPQMRVSPLGQREINRARVDRMAASFDPEQIGTPTVSHRGDWYWIIDGQHRIETLKEVGWGDQQVQCWTYEALTESEEAEMFLKLNDVLSVSAFDKYTKGVAAGRLAESDIDRIVRTNGLVVSRDKLPGGIGAVGTLRRIYDRAGAGVFARSLRVVRDAYGDPGLEAPVLDGIGYLCQRYNGALDDKTAVERLAKAHGGVNGLMGKAEVIRKSTGKPRGQCVAAAAVEIINAGRGGAKLPAWWKS